MPSGRWQDLCHDNDRVRVDQCDVTEIGYLDPMREIDMDRGGRMISKTGNDESGGRYGVVNPGDHPGR